MTYYRQRPTYQKQKPNPTQIAAGLAAMAPTAEASERVADFTVRVLKPGDPTATHRRGGGDRARKRGLAVEGVYRGKGATAILHQEGYRTLRPQGSMGAADVWAIRDTAPATEPAARLVQVKRRKEFDARALSEAVARFLGIDGKHAPFTVAPEVRRECWLWVDYEGWVCRIYLASDDSLMYVGSRADEVRRSIERLLDRASKIQQERTGDDAGRAFRARLEGREPESI